MKKLILILACIVIPQTTFAETKIVTVPVLNVRQCPNTDCNILSKLNKGDKVKVIKTTGQWSEIDQNGQTGYVITRSLRDSYMPILYWALGILLVYLIFSSMSKSYNKRCPKCGKWNAMYDASKELVSENKTKVTKILHTKHKSYTSTREVLVPGMKREYKVTKKCKYCGDTYTTTETETKEL